MEEEEGMEIVGRRDQGGEVGETGEGGEKGGVGRKRDLEGNKENIGDWELRDLRNNKLERQRSGSVSVQKKSKQSDVQSISTMAGTLHSHKSHNLIQDIDPHHPRTIPIPVAIPKPPEPPQSLHPQPLPHPSPHQPQSTWSLNKSGHLISQNPDITTIKYYFIKSASKQYLNPIIHSGMSIMRDLEDLITIKTQGFHSIKCLFMMCLPMLSVSDRCVYQLERCRDRGKGKGSRIRLVLISGVQEKFQEFKRNFYYELWEKNVLKLSNFQALTLLCYANKHIIKEITESYQQACDQFQIKSLSSQQQLQIWQNQLMRKFKHSQQKLKSTIFPKSPLNLNSPLNSPYNAPPSPQITRSPLTEILLQRILLYQIPICSLYLKLQMDTNREFFHKKKYIVGHYSVREIFQYLEISRKLLSEGWGADRRVIGDIGGREELPYWEAVGYLDQLNIVLSPLENIGKISNFADKLLQCFQSSLGRSDSMMDMDNQLPLTIYCILISKNTQLKPIISFLRDYFEPQDDFQTENRTLAALKAGLEYVRQEWDIGDGRSQGKSQGKGQGKGQGKMGDRERRQKDKENLKEK